MKSFKDFRTENDVSKKDLKQLFKIKQEAIKLKELVDKSDYAPVEVSNTLLNSVYHVINNIYVELDIKLRTTKK